MTPFGFLKRLAGAADDDALERRREQDVERIEQGGLPAAAHARLTELAAREDFFTSGLAVSDFALTRFHDVRPVAQVMGSSVYKVGWQRYPWGSSWSGGSITELRTLTDAWNRARALAIGRLDQEARLAGADAVIDVSFEHRRHAFLDDEIEVVINGTAVRMPPAVAPRTDGAPRLSDLSTADVTLLHRSGYDVAGIVCATSVTYVSASAQTRRATVGWQRFQGNVELTDFTQGVYTARENALGRAQADAARLGADGVVGVDLDVGIEVREWEQNDTKYEDLVVTVHVLGTAVTQRGEHEPLNPGLIVRQGGQSP